MKFYLVRHGEAVSALSDGQRPLSARGRDQVAAIARMALARGVKVEEIRHSGILRARETAEILSSYLTPTQGICQSAGLLPEDEPEIAKAELEAAQQSIMLVGHLPFMGRLAALLVKNPSGSTGEFAPATMLCCAKIGGMWRIEWRLAP